MASAPPPARKLTDEELEKLRALVLERAAKMSEEDLRALLDNEAKAEQKMASLRVSLPGLVSQAKLGFRMVRDYWKGDYRKLPWWSIASVAAALGYFITPTDLLPDFIPLIGYLDDATVLAAVMTGIREDLKRYCEAKGIKLDE